MRLIYFLLLFGVATIAVKADSPIDINVIRGSNAEIVFKIVPKKNIHTYIAELPWNTPLALTFAILPMGMGDALKRVYYLNSPIPGTIDLVKGKTYEGNIDLLHFFPDLLKENSRQDLIFFWHWDVSGKSFITDFKNTEGGYGGWVLIPQGHLVKK